MFDSQDSFSQLFAAQIENARRNPKDLSTRELEELIRRSPEKHQVSTECDPPIVSQGDSSKSYLAAMKALQTKVCSLEHENIELSEKVNYLEGKFSTCREQVQQRMIVDLKTVTERERATSYKISSLEDELQNSQLANSKLSELLKIKDTQIGHSEAELSRNFEQFALDKQGTHLELESLSRALKLRTSEDKETKRSLEQFSRENSLLREEVVQAKRVVQGLESETVFLRENSHSQQTKLQKAYDLLGEKYNKQQTELTQKVKQLQLKNRSLNDINVNQARQLEYLQKEVSLLNSDGNRPRQRTDSSLNVNKNTERPPPRVSGHKKGTPKGKKIISLQNPESSLEKAISSLESETAELNQKYRSLLAKSNENPSDLAEIRKEIGEIAQEIDRKSKKTMILKRKYQESLKGKLPFN